MTAQTGTLYWLGVLLADAELDPTETLLMIGLADHVDADDECYVGIDTLARYARVSYGTARRRLAALTKRERLVRTRRRRADGNLSTYSWLLVRPGPPPNMRDDQRAPGRAVTSAHLGARAEVPSDEPPSSPNPSAPEGALFAGGPDTAAGFDAFWRAWPKGRGSKAEARAVWPAAVKAAGGNPSVIVEGARRYAADPNLPEPQFIPHARRWLKGERWADPPLPPRTGAPNRAKVAVVDDDRDAPAGRLDL